MDANVDKEVVLEHVVMTMPCHIMGRHKSNTRDMWSRAYASHWSVSTDRYLIQRLSQVLTTQKDLAQWRCQLRIISPESLSNDESDGVLCKSHDLPKLVSMSAPIVESDKVTEDSKSPDRQKSLLPS